MCVMGACECSMDKTGYRGAIVVLLKKSSRHTIILNLYFNAIAHPSLQYMFQAQKNTKRYSEAGTFEEKIFKMV